MTNSVAEQAGPRAGGPPTKSAVPKRRGSTSPVTLGLVGLIGLLVVGELLPRTGLIDRAFVPPSTEIGAALAVQLGDPTFWDDVWQTVSGWALGLLIATTAAVVAGIVLGSSRFLREATASTIEFLRPIPSVALIPLAVLLFGTSLESKLLLVVYASFWPMLIQVLYGAADIDPVAYDTARVYRFTVWTRLRRLTWPTALPYVMTGLRLSAAVALILAVTSELVIGNPGLGNRVAVAQSSGAIATTYALVFITGLIGVLVNVAARLVERRALRWHQSYRAEEL